MEICSHFEIISFRFLCKLKEPELLEPLMPAITACLEHRHSYVRRNAVLAIFTIYRNFEFLIPDAPELIATYLDGEQDMSCRRNAFLMLLHAKQSRALAYLTSCLDQVPTFGDILQLVIVELIYKVRTSILMYNAKMLENANFAIGNFRFAWRIHLKNHASSDAFTVYSIRRVLLFDMNLPVLW